MNRLLLGFATFFAISGCSHMDDEQACLGDNPDISLRACTVLIQSDQSSHAPKLRLAIDYGNRGLAYARKGLYDLAIADTARAIELNPLLAEGYCNRGADYSDKGLHDQAIADENTAIELNPSYAVAYYNRGRDYYFQGHFDQAIADN